MSGARGGHRGRSREPRERRKISRSKEREDKRLSRDELYAQARSLAQKTIVHYEPEYLSDEPKAEARPVRDAIFDLIAQKDYGEMAKNNVIAVTPRVKQLLLMQTVVGHARSGHGQFKRAAYFPNATIDDVYKALDLNPSKIRQQRQDIIDGIYWYVEQALQNPYNSRLRHLWNKDGAPLAGANIFINETIDVKKGDAIKVLRGIYLASTIDNYVEWRTRVQNRFGIALGGGRNLALNLLYVTAYNETLQSLATEAHNEDFIRTYSALGAIIDQDTVSSEENIVNGYVRLAKGKGVSDDAAIITAGVKFGGIPTFYGAFLCDAVDTWDKSTPEIKRDGQDEALGNLILEESQHRGIDLEVTENDVEDYIFCAAIDPERASQYPDCSQRRFLLQSYFRKEKGQYYALRLHKDFVEAILAKKEPELPRRLIGFASIPSDHFYSTWLERYDASHETGLILSPKHLPHHGLGKRRATVLHPPRIRDEWD